MARAGRALAELAALGCLWGGRPLRRVAAVEVRGCYLVLRYEDGSVAYVPQSALASRRFVVACGRP